MSTKTTMRSWEEFRKEIVNTPEREAAVAVERRLWEFEQRLYDLRQSRGHTQTDLADKLGVSQANISRIEHQEDMKVSTLDGYLRGLGGRLQVSAVFPDGETVPLIE